MIELIVILFGILAGVSLAILMWSIITSRDDH